MSPVAPELAAQNRLLAALPPDELRRVSALLTLQELAHAQTIVEPWGRVDRLIFPIGSLMSVVAETADGQSVEVATVGTEGMIGAGAFLGEATSPLHTICQVAGPALLGRTADLVADDTGSPFRDAVLRYYETMLVQASITAACNRLHPLEQRAARWLLTTSDRLGSAGFDLTHEFFAVMLGSHRPSVSLAAQILQKAGLITYRRGHVEILDRDGLARAACDCYATITDHYERTMGRPLA